MEEMTVMALAKDSKWLATLYAAFQDKDYLYLIAEYLPGGTLRNLIEANLEEGEEPLTEDQVKFYIAEIVLGIEELHNLGFVHRCVSQARGRYGSLSNIS